MNKANRSDDKSLNELMLGRHECKPNAIVTQSLCGIVIHNFRPSIKIFPPKIATLTKFGSCYNLEWPFKFVERVRVMKKSENDSMQTLQGLVTDVLQELEFSVGDFARKYVDRIYLRHSDQVRYLEIEINKQLLLGDFEVNKSRN